MAMNGVKSLNLAGVIVTFLSLTAVGACPLPVSGQTIPQMKTISPQFIAEPGSPVEVTTSKVDVEVDAFDTPIAARVYLDYRNVGTKTIQAVKFRVGYIDNEGKVRGSFHAAHGMTLEPGGTGSHKWRGERVDPRIYAVKVRTLQVKFADGTMWESAKMNNVVTPVAGGTTSGARSIAGPAEVEDTMAAPEAGAAAAGDPSGEPATGEAATYESVTKTNKRFGSSQPAADPAGASVPDGGADPAAGQN